MANTTMTLTSAGKPDRPDPGGGRRPHAEIAARLPLTEATVKSYVSRMPATPNLANRTPAGLLARDADLP